MLYFISLGAGVLVGIIYSLINVRSPAPPLVALVRACRRAGHPCGQAASVGFDFLSRLAGSEMRSAYVWHAAGPPCRRGRKDFRDRFPGEPLMTDAPDLIVTNARVTTLDRG